MSSLADYIGRKIDLVTFQGTIVRGEIQLQESLHGQGDSGMVCTGLVKLGQSVLIELLTPVGSLPYNPLRGTSLVPSIAGNLVRTPADLSTLFTTAREEIFRNFELRELDSDPDDEKLKEITLLDAQMAGGMAVLRIAVESRQGKAQVILPVRVSL